MGSPRDTGREGERTAHEPPEATEPDLARYATTRAALLHMLWSPPSAIFAAPLVDVEVGDAKEHALLMPLHFTVRALPDDAVEAVELTPAEHEALKQHQRASLYTALLANSLFDAGTHENASPRDDEREQLHEQARELRRRRKEREGTDADPLVRSRRAAERLRAIKL